MRGKFGSSAAAILVGALFMAGEVAAAVPPTSGPVVISGVPLPETLPLSCTTASFTIQAQTGPNGVFPKSAQCGTPAQPCSEYHYKITSALKNIDHALFSVSATQQLFGAAPSYSVFSPGAGDNTTGFLTFAKHEYAIRFNSNQTKSDETQIWISGSSGPRIGTVLIRSGSKSFESCVIATPGIVGDAFQPVSTIQTVLVAGGKCTATLIYDAFGNLVDVTTSPPCTTNTHSNPVLVNGAPLKNNNSPHGITFGTGTTTCYGPPRPSIPKCVCTATPCP